MDLERLDRINLGVVHGGTVDKSTFQQISSLARRFLVEEKRVLELSKQIEDGISFLRQVAEDMVNGKAENQSAMKMVKRYRAKLDVQLQQRTDWMTAANRQQALIENLLNGTEALYKLIRDHLDVPTEETANAIRNHLAENRL